MVQKILLKIKKWMRRHIIDEVPPHLDDLFDGKKEIELWECATCGSRGICQQCRINKK
jgi:hypothetical protein